MRSSLSSTDWTVDLGPWQRTALIVGVVGLIGALIGAFINAEAFFESYLFIYLFWLGLSLGCLALLFVQHMAGGSWGALIQRPLEAGVALLPVMAVLILPIFVGLGSLYVWTDAEYLATHPTVDFKSGYLNPLWYIIRNVLYFAVWIGSGLMFLRLSARQDKEPAASGSIGYRMKRSSAMWLIMHIMAMTFAGVDWAMSLTPVWWSGIYSVILMIGQVISATAFIIGVMVMLAARLPKIDELLTAKRLQDLGNFLMAFTLFWAYTSFSQVIILWSNNVIETNTWYVLRLGPLWSGLAGFLLFFGFFAPFLILFSRWVKRQRRALVTVAAWSLFIQLTNLFFFIVPTYDRSGFQVTWLDALLFVGIGGVWLSFYFRSLSSRPVVPLHDPRLTQPSHASAAHPAPAHGVPDHG